MNSTLPPLVSVVIPHLGEDAVLKKCLDSVRAQTYPKQRVEVILVMNDHLKRSLSFPLLPNETLVWEPRHHAYNARNAGIRSTQGSIIALTDSDAVPYANWIEEAVAGLKPGIDLLAGAVELTFSKHPLTAAACYEKLYAFDQEKNVRFNRSATINLVGRKSLFELEPFNQLAVSGEDFFWTSRMVDRGANLAFCPTAVVRHPARESLTELLQKARRVSVNYPGRGKGLKTLKLAGRHYFSLYLTSPSRSRTFTSTPREIMLARIVSVLLQLVKANHLLSARRDLVPTTKRP
jgi:cellulose synthase/poly-beta-1,6-N-acetylglucosamine synthase-like glycosyltransferase